MALDEFTSVKAFLQQAQRDGPIAVGDVVAAQELSVQFEKIVEAHSKG